MIRLRSLQVRAASLARSEARVLRVPCRIEEPHVRTIRQLRSALRPAVNSRRGNSVDNRLAVTETILLNRTPSRMVICSRGLFVFPGHRISSERPISAPFCRTKQLGAIDFRSCNSVCGPAAIPGESVREASTTDVTASNAGIDDEAHFAAWRKSAKGAAWSQG